MTTSTVIAEQDRCDAFDPANPDARYFDNRAHLNERALTAVTPNQADLIRVILSIHDVTRRWPSCLGVARAVGRNVTSIRRRLLRLERLGVILWAGGDVRVVLKPDGLFMTLAEVIA